MIDFYSIPGSDMPTWHLFLDESGKLKAGSKTIAFAGWLGETTKWNDSFNAAWTLQLRSGKKRLAYFSMAEAMNLRGEFKGWEFAERDKMVYKLIDLVSEVGYVALSATMSLSVWDSLDSETRRRFDNNSQMAVMETIMLALAKWSRKDKVAIVCDDEESLAIGFYRMVNKLKNRHANLRSAIASVCFGDDKAAPPLQAADLYAYLCREELERQIERPSEAVSPFYQYLTNRRIMHTDQTFLDGDCLRMISKANRKR